MGKRGPPKKPPELRARAGSRIRVHELRPCDLAKSVEEIHQPAWLRDDPEACEIWEEHRRILDPLGLLTAADSEAFALLCSLMASYRQARREWIAGGVCMTTASGETKQNPAASQCVAIMGRLRPLAASFGLTPGDRLHKANGDGDALDKLLKLEVG